MAKFALYNGFGGDTVANVVMDSDLINPEAGIVDPATLTLRPITNGSHYTLIPFENDVPAMAFKRLHIAYRTITDKPALSLGTMINRYDGLIDAVGTMFKKHKFVKINGPADLDALINPRQHPDYEFQYVEFTALGDIYEDVVASKPEGGEVTDLENSGHVCDDTCNHE